MHKPGALDHQVLFNTQLFNHVSQVQDTLEVENKMTGNADQLPVMLFWGGEMVCVGDHKSVHYSLPPKSVCFLSRSSSHDELVSEVHSAMNTTEDNTKFTLYGRYPSTLPGGEVLFVSFPLTSNQSWQWFLEATLLFQPVHVYVVAEKITVDRSFRENQMFVHGEPLLKNCNNRVSTSGCCNGHISDGEREDRCNAGDDGRVRKIRRFCHGEPLCKHNATKANSSYREDEVAFYGGNAAIATDALVTSNPSHTATQAAAAAIDAVAATNPSSTATPTAIATQAAADATDVAAANPSSAATPAATTTHAAIATATQAADAFAAVREGQTFQTTRRLKQLATPATASATRAAAVEEEKKRWLTDILNHLTRRNSKRVLEQVKGANIDNVESLAAFAKIAYDKAMRDTAFHEMLVDICIPLNCILPGFTVDGNELNFGRCLSDCCHKELQSGKKGFEHADEWRCRRWRILNLCNVKLIGELYIKEWLEEGIVHCCIKKILWEYENPDEAEITTLCYLMYKVGESMDKHEVKKQPTDMDIYFEEMSKLSKHPDLSSKLKKILLNLVDLRKNKWQHKTADLTLNISIQQKKFTLKVKSSYTIYNLKAMIKAKKGFLVCKQHLYCGVVLLVDDHTIADYNLQNNCTLTLYA